MTTPSIDPVVIVILGPTASGKTNLAIELAAHYKLDIHNIDSRQLYKGMDIGTAKPTKKQQRQVKHLLIDICNPNERLNIHEFQKIANNCVKESLQKHSIALLAGGSGLYLKSITQGLLPPAVPPQQNLRKQLQKINQLECHQLLKICDPISAEKVSPGDSIRTIRALEVFYATGKPISSLRSTEPPPWKLIELGLNPKDLDQRIKKRTQEMYENGLIEETKGLIEQYGYELPLLKTIGYEEALCIIKGSISLSEAILITNQRTRNFAKRQRTWFKNQHSAKWLNDENPLKESITLIQEVIGLTK
tara:strand:- start:303 stop:1217 length:915 start_codon:yes stop_codon:yes gene_type:complete